MWKICEKPQICEMYPKLGKICEKDLSHIHIKIQSLVINKFYNLGTCKQQNYDHNYIVHDKSIVFSKNYQKSSKILVKTANIQNPGIPTAQSRDFGIGIFFQIPGFRDRDCPGIKHY